MKKHRLFSTRGSSAWRRLSRIVPAVLVAGGLLGVLATSAEALDPGRVVARSVTNSLAKSVVVGCPAGTVVISGGGRIVDEDGDQFSDYDVTMSRMAPLILPSGAVNWEVAGQEQAGAFAADWALDTIAVCATKPADLQLVTGQPASDLTSGAKVSCPGTKKVIGVGYKITGVGRVVADDVEPAANLRSATVVLSRAPGADPGESEVTPFAFCTGSVNNLQREQAHADKQVRTDLELSASCEGSQKLHGWGYEINGGGGRVSVNEVAPGETSVRVQASAQAGFNQPWGLDVYAICGDR